MEIRKITKRFVKLFAGGSKATRNKKTKTGNSKKRKRVVGQRDNDVHLDKRQSLRGTIIFNGKGNVIRFLEGSRFIGDIKISGDNNFIEFGPHTKIKGGIVLRGSGQKVTFGEYTTAVEIMLICEGYQNVIIGKWCMFSRKIEIRTSEPKSVIDPAMRERLDSLKPVIIGDHVWVGLGVCIHQGAVIPSDSIVGAMSLVKDRFGEDGVVLAGSPARVVKTGITWSRAKKSHFSRDELDAWKAEGGWQSHDDLNTRYVV